jgi:predicted nucleic acid-binding protein
VGDVLVRPKMRRYFPEGGARDHVARLAAAAALSVEEARADNPVRTTDPDDDYLVVLALASQATSLISGDRHLLALSEFGEETAPIRVLTPREFLERLAESEYLESL